DLGLRVWAPSLEELFAVAAEGVLALALNLEGVAAQETRALRVKGMDREELLVVWLQELLYLWTGKGFAGRRFAVRIGSPPGQSSEEPWWLEGEVTGEAWDDERHEAYTDVKAVTYHNLQIREEEGGDGRLFQVELILDT
ncbi:MAG: protein archease, partial [Candidatus Eisenbacteria bacterium]|nr:protein archease [Candidatus Eisenbacteria bacterium]